MKPTRRVDAERTNVVIDAKLVERVKRHAKVKTTRDAVHVALEHYVRSRDYSGVLALRGTGGVAEGYEWAGVTPRSANDCLIAIHAISGGIPLLHRDRDFDSIAIVEPRLMLVDPEA